MPFFSQEASPLRRRISAYAIPFLLMLAAASLAVYWLSHGRHKPDLSGNLTKKLAYYQDHRDDFNVVYTGDSLTYCGVHPELLDPLLGTRSFNISVFAHWFATQYSFTGNLLPLLPKGATVVWLVNHDNFKSGQIQVRKVYPLGLANMPRYLWWGFSLSSMQENLSYYHPLTHIYAVAGEIRKQLLSRRERLLYRFPAPRVVPTRRKAGASPADINRALFLEHGQQPGVRRMEVDRRRGHVVGVSLYFTGGGFWYIEKDPAYFRSIQMKLVPEADHPPTDQEVAKRPPATPDPNLLAAFEAMLDLYQQAGVRVVVVENERGLLGYAHSEALRNHWRRLMATWVEPRVRARGFAYVRVDYSTLTDEHFFDYSHLNSSGVIRYSPLLAAALKPHLAPHLVLKGSPNAL